MLLEFSPMGVSKKKLLGGTAVLLIFMIIAAVLLFVEGENEGWTLIASALVLWVGSMSMLLRWSFQGKFEDSELERMKWVILAAMVANLLVGIGCVMAVYTNEQTVKPSPPRRDGWSVGGQITGTEGLGSAVELFLHDYADHKLSLDRDGPFTFADLLPTGASWAVAVNQPSSGSCQITNQAGTNITQNFNGVLVACSPR